MREKDPGLAPNLSNHPNTMPEEDSSQEAMDIYDLLQQHIHNIMGDVVLSPILREGRLTSERLRKPR